MGGLFKLYTFVVEVYNNCIIYQHTITYLFKKSPNVETSDTQLKTIFGNLGEQRICWRQNGEKPTDGGEKAILPPQ